MITIKKAVKYKSKLRLGLVGVSGSGKTFSALMLAKQLGKKVLLVDTENSGGLYADHKDLALDYDIIELAPPFTVKQYIEAIRAGEEGGYEVIILDSISHAWAGEGGLLEKKENLDLVNPKSNTWANWRKITPEHNQFVEAMIRSKAHLIVTMRAKTEYVLETNEQGKQVPKKVGLAPIQREGMDYEFTIVFDIRVPDHIAIATKDRTSLFADVAVKIDEEVGKKIKKWLNDGATKEEELEGGKIIDASTMELIPALKDITAAKTKDALLLVYNKYPSLRLNKSFTNALSKRKQEVKAVTQ